MCAFCDFSEWDLLLCNLEGLFDVLFGSPAAPAPLYHKFFNDRFGRAAARRLGLDNANWQRNFSRFFARNWMPSVSDEEAE